MFEIIILGIIIGIIINYEIGIITIMIGIFLAITPEKKGVNEDV